MSAPARLVVLVAGLAACTEAGPIDLDPSDETGAAGSPETQPPFTPPGPATGGGPTGSGTAGTAGSPAVGSGGATAGAGGTAVGTAGQTAPSGGAGSPAGGRGGAPGGPVSFRPLLGIVPTAIGATGGIVAGHWNGRAAVWTPMTGVLPLSSARADDDTSRATGISLDGTIIVGWSARAERSEAVRWTAPSKPEPLGFASGGDERSEAIFVSDDGSTVVCTSAKLLGDAFHAATFRWRKGVKTLVAPLPGDDGNEPRAMSADGSTIAGVSWNVAARSQRAFVWSDALGTTDPLPLAGGANVLQPRALSADGSVIVGDAFTARTPFELHGDDPVQAFRWTRAGGTALLTGAGRAAHVGGVSADGAVVGAALDASPWVWTLSQMNGFPFPAMVAEAVVLDRQGRALAGRAEVGREDLALAVWISSPMGLVPIVPPQLLLPFQTIPLAFSADGHSLLTTTGILSVP